LLSVRASNLVDMSGDRFGIHEARKFADKYAKVSSEKQFAQTFWRDFFSHLLQIDDLTSTGIAFEVPVRSHLTGRVKWIDVLWPGVLLVEHKSAGEDLDQAEQQAREYLLSLDQIRVPPVVIICDFARFRIIEVLAGTTHEFSLEDLPSNLDNLNAIFSNKGIGSTAVEISADTKAADLMANLFLSFEKAGYTGHETSVFLVRVLFLLFAEDTRMMRKSVFTNFVSGSPPSGTGLGAMLQELFLVLNTEKRNRSSTLTPELNEFPYVNGGLFAEAISNFSFTPEMRQALIDATSYDWSGISPAIFGSLFQSVRDEETRRTMGEHFTSEQNILKVIGDLFLNDFNDRLAKAWDSPIQLKRFHTELGDYNFFDPACGSGNFLVVSLKYLRSLELRTLARIQELEGTGQMAFDVSLTQKIGLSQFHGIEIDEWSSAIARVALHLADHQSNLQWEEIIGSAPDRLPLTESANIVNANALRIEWSEVAPLGDKTFIMGNPPFFGARYQTPDQKADTLAVWGNVKGAGEMDFVSNWHLIAARQIATHGGHAAFVSTNSLTQGEQPGILFPQIFSLGLGVTFAHRSFVWKNDAKGQATVHCVIIGLSKRLPSLRSLWFYPDPKGQPVATQAKRINAYLLDAPEVIVSSRSTPLSPQAERMDFGSMPNDGGHLSDISASDADTIRSADPVAAKYLRRLIGSRELIHNEERFCLWLVGANPNDIRCSPELSRRVEEVRKLRLESKRAATNKLAKKPAEFGENRQPKGRFIAVPSVSSERREYVPMAVFEPDVIANNLVLTVPMNSLASFGFLQSKVFALWNEAVSGRLGNGMRISVSITYNNFVFPVISERMRGSIEEGAEAVLSARAMFPDNSLADLYDSAAMPAELRRAHEKLDAAVLESFGMKLTVSREEILSALFQRYKEATEGLVK
jgi:N-6 DNA Methylase